MRRVYFDPPEARWQLTSVSPSATRIKEVVIRILMEVANLRTNFHLAKSLEIFRRLSIDEVQPTPTPTLPQIRLARL